MAQHTYDPTPSDKLFPRLEYALRFGWIAVLIVAAAVAYRFWKPEAPKPLVPVLHFAPATQWTSDPGLTFAPALSPDGRIAAFASNRDSQGSLAIWTRAVDSNKATRLTSGEFNESDPDFSPDNRLIAYRSERDGGGIYVDRWDRPPGLSDPARLVARSGWMPKFSPDGKWIAYFTLTGAADASATFGLGQIFIVPSEGGEPRRIQPDFPYARHPIWAPSGRRLLFPGTRKDGVKDWWLASIDGGEAQRTNAVDWLSRSLTSVGSPAAWQGETIYFSGAEDRDSHVWALPISASTMQVTGPPRRLTNGSGQEQQCAIAPDGRLLYSNLQFSSDLWSVPIDAADAKVLGALHPLSSDSAKAQLPFLSADASKLVYLSDKSGMRDIWVADPDGKSGLAVTAFRRIGYRPVLSPDGKRLVYPTTLDGRCTVVLQDVGLPAGRRFALKGCFSIWDWSPDGSSLLTFQMIQPKVVDLMNISTGERRTVLSHPANNLFSPRFSPDGRWIAFSFGASSTRGRIFVAPLRTPPAPEREWIAVGPEDSGDPTWSPDGNVLYFHSRVDGYHCIWAQKLGPGKKPAGDSTAILHLHSVALGMYFLQPMDFGLAVSKDRLILNLAKGTGNLWTTMLPPK